MNSASNKSSRERLFVLFIGFGIIGRNVCASRLRPPGALFVLLELLGLEAFVLVGLDGGAGADLAGASIGTEGSGLLT